MDEISRMEKILRGDPIDPITRLEKFCAKAAGTYTGDPLTPVTRLEWFLDQISGGGGGETKSTLIYKPSEYNGTVHYTDSAAQQLTAPEGIVYDKVWATDEILTRYGGANLLKHYFIMTVNLNSYNMRNRSSMESIVLQRAEQIPDNAFNGNSSLTDVVIKTDTRCALSATGAFTGTPFASGGTGGRLWVPASLIDSYTNATNWSTIIGRVNNSIQAIEGSVWE